MEPRDLCADCVFLLQKHFWRNFLIPNLRDEHKRVLDLASEERSIVCRDKCRGANPTIGEKLQHRCFILERQVPPRTETLEEVAVPTGSRDSPQFPTLRMQFQLRSGAQFRTPCVQDFSQVIQLKHARTFLITRKKVWQRARKIARLVAKLRIGKARSSRSRLPTIASVGFELTGSGSPPDYSARQCPQPRSRWYRHPSSGRLHVVCRS